MSSPEEKTLVYKERMALRLDIRRRIGHKSYIRRLTKKGRGLSPPLVTSWFLRMQLWYWTVPYLVRPTSSQVRYADLIKTKPQTISLINPIELIERELQVTPFRALATRIISKGDFPAILLGLYKPHLE